MVPLIFRQLPHIRFVEVSGRSGGAEDEAAMAEALLPASDFFPFIFSI